MTTNQAPTTAAPAAAAPDQPANPWSGFYREPTSLYDMWLDTDPGEDRARVGRIVLLTLISIAPAVLAGPLYAIARRALPRRPEQAAEQTAEPTAEPTAEQSAEPDASAETAEPKSPGRLHRHLTASRDRIAAWPGWYRTPPTRPDAWYLSADVNSTRVPADSEFLKGIWFLSNHLDRPLLMLAAPIAPAILVGPIHWLVISPARRWAAYAVLFTIRVIAPSAVS